MEGKQEFQPGFGLQAAEVRLTLPGLGDLDMMDSRLKASGGNSCS